MNALSSSSETSAANSRRRFLKTAAAVSLVPVAGLLLRERSPDSANSVLAPSLPSSGEKSSPPVPASTFPRFQTFQSLAGTEFTTASSDAQPGLRLVLAKVELGPHHGRDGSEQFGLHFTAPAGQRLSERTYDFQHGQLGALQVFISTVSTAESGAPDLGYAFVSLPAAS